MRNDIQISKHKMFGLSVTPLSKLSNKILSVNFIVINNIVPFVYKKKNNKWEYRWEAVLSLTQ